jgi:hypothetical protein
VDGGSSGGRNGRGRSSAGATVAGSATPRASRMKERTTPPVVVEGLAKRLRLNATRSVTVTIEPSSLH